MFNTPFVMQSCQFSNIDILVWKRRPFKQTTHENKDGTNLKKIKEDNCYVYAKLTINPSARPR